MKISRRDLRRMMKKAGITMEEVDSVNYVDIVLSSGDIIRINEPIVAKVNVAGQTTYQISGKEELIKKEEDAKIEFSNEDINIIIEQTGVDRELAIKALKMTNGDIAEAILLLKEANLS